MIDFFNGFSAHFIYILLFFLLFLCGVGFPMAEELVLLAGGALVASGILDPFLMFLFTFLGVIVGDVLLFLLGRGLARRLTTTSFFTRLFPPQKLAKGNVFFARHGSTTVFLARFIPGLRAPTFLLSGTMKMPFWRFVAMDTLAGLIFVPLTCWMGYFFVDRFEAVASWFESFERALLALLVVTGLSWLAWRYWGKRNRGDTTVRTRATDLP